MALKTIDIELALFKEFDFRKKLIITNITPLSRMLKFECDLLVLSESNFATGFEIKISASDLKNDLKKKHIYQLNENKEKCQRKYFNKFKYFNYVVPLHLEKKALEQIPDFCGLYIYDQKQPKKRQLYCVKKPSKIFNYKWTDNEKYNIARLGTMRIFSLKNKIKNLTS